MLDFLTFALILFSPTQLGYHFWPQGAYVWGIRVDFLSPVFYLTDILVLGILIAYVIPRIKKYKLSFAPILASFLFLVFNICSASQPVIASYRWLKILEMGFLIYYFAREFKKDWLIPLVLANFYTCLITWGQFFKKGSLGGWLWWLGERSFNLATPGIAKIQLGPYLFLRPYATFSHPNSLAGFLLVSCLLFLLTKRKLVIVPLLTILVTFSWSAYLAILLLLVYVFWKKWGVKGAAIGVLLLIGIALQSIKVGLLEERSIVERIFLIQNALQLIKAHPFLGVGLGNFIPAQLELSFPRGQYNFLQPVHNIYLLVASETGLIGLGIFLYFLFYLFKKSHLISIIQYPLFTILLLGLFDHYWLTLQQNMLLLALVVSFSLSPLKNISKKVI